MKKKPRKDGRYQGKIQVGVIDGRPKYKYVYGKTQKEVANKLAALRVDRGNGVDLGQKTNLGWWIDRWLARAAQQMTPEWYATCAARANLWKDRLGWADISKITEADLEDVLLDLSTHNPATGKPSAKKTLVEYRNIISRIFDFAVRNRVLTVDPSKHLTVEKTAKKTKRDAIPDDQIAAIRETPHETQLPCLIMIYAGLRLGEVCALTWSDVDLDKAEISVNKSYNFKANEVKAPKTAAGTREIPIPPPLLPFLRSAPRTSLLVCPHRGGVYTRCAWEYALQCYSNQLGFPLRAHNLRHTCCTLYYEAGIDILTAQRWMGHADPQTTTNIYTHLREKKESENAVKLAAFFLTDSKKQQN